MEGLVRLGAAAVLSLVGLAVANPAHAQLDALKRKAKETVEQKVSGKDGKPTGAAAGSEAEADASALEVGEGAWANYDFVPGPRVLFADDLTRDRVGNFPQRLEFLNGSMEVVEWQGRRWLRKSGAFGAFAVPLPEALPERFTIEFETTIPWGHMVVHSGAPEHIADGHVAFGSIGSDYVRLEAYQVGLDRADQTTAAAQDPHVVLAAVLNGRDIGEVPVTIRVQGDGRYVKVYLNEVRVANVPNAAFGRSDKVWFQIASNNNNPVYLTDISINAGGLAMYDALSAEGRVATQGILFDTGSDRIRPESTPTLNEIAEMLRQYTDLRLTIEGHTDATGDAAANQTLSEQRAAAVKAWLVAQGIDASRLESAGFGPSKPAASNETPEGRQQNRRVELVKM